MGVGILCRVSLVKMRLERGRAERQKRTATFSFCPWHGSFPQWALKCEKQGSDPG